MNERSHTKITSALIMSYERQQMNNSVFPVSFLLQCDSESDIDDKVSLLFPCLFTRHMKEPRVVNNKFELST